MATVGRPFISQTKTRRFIMKFKKSCLEFEVQSLDETKVLLRTWNQVLARHRQREAQSPRVTEEHLVNIVLEDRQRPVEPVILQFLAPQDLLDGLLAELKDKGFACPVIKDVTGLWTRYRLHVDQH
jgi:hypothetical protein